MTSWLKYHKRPGRLFDPLEYTLFMAELNFSFINLLTTLRIITKFEARVGTATNFHDDLILLYSKLIRLINEVASAAFRKLIISEC